MWSFDVNPNTRIENFATVIEADIPSSGSWRADYEAACTKNGLVLCPHIKAGPHPQDVDKESCKVVNVIVDLSSWRAMLLACCTVGSKVADITVHGSRLSPQHVQDLAVALKKMGTCQSVKLQYLDWQDGQGLDATNIPLYQDALSALLSDSTCLEAVSLKGNSFPPELLNPVLDSLAQNFKLITLNLAGNLLTDDSARQFVKAVRCNTSIKYVSFANNRITGDFLPALAEILDGTEQSAEDDATIKGNTKLVTERNKGIKELNKKRKKTNLPEIKEIATLEVTVKREKVMYVVNRTLKRLDLSCNPDLDAGKVAAFAQGLADAPQGTALPAAAATYQSETDPKLVVDATRCGDLSAVNTAPQPWVEILV